MVPQVKGSLSGGADVLVGLEELRRVGGGRREGVRGCMYECSMWM